MENILATMQRRKILFLISLPRTLEFEKDKDDVNECINELRELQVDVREHITPKDLVDANRYDIVIVVAHHDCDNDDLILAEGTMKMTDFVNSLPSDFSGVIDFASCYSAMAYGAIKNHCPHCKVQAALIEVELLQRIIMYPALVEHLNEDAGVDYHDAYEEVSKAFDEDVESYAVKQDVPKMTQLGQQMSSIYSPSEVKRDYPFQILVFFHYDADKNVVKIKAQRRQTDSIIREDFEIPVEMKEGDRISLSLSFDSTDNDHIKISNDEFKKDIILKKEMIIEYFKVKVLKDFCGNGFLAEIEMAKDNICFVRCAFNIDVSEKTNIAPAEIAAVIPHAPEKTGNLFLKYNNVCLASFLNKEDMDGFRAILKNKEFSDEIKILEARNYLFNKNQLLLKQIDSYINNKIKSIDDKGNDLLGRIKKQYKDLKRNTSKIDGDFKKILFNGKENVLFQNIPIDSFIPIEYNFLDLVLDLIYLDKQMVMLDRINEIRRLIRCGDKADKVQIKNKAYDFWTEIEEGTDKELFSIFTEKSSTNSLISKGKVSAPYLTLLIAMSTLKYESIKNSQDDWKISTDNFLGTTSVPTKFRINDVMALLKKDEIIKYIDDYQNKCSTISICAYYLRKINVSIM